MYSGTRFSIARQLAPMQIGMRKAVRTISSRAIPSIPSAQLIPPQTQRLAALVSIRDVAYRSTPEELSARRAEPWRAAQAPALSALARVARVLARLGESWGPTGSVAFELATGLPVASRSSDLDLILRREESPGAHEAAELLEDLAQVASPARLDAVIETAQGGVSLADLAVGSRCLFKARRR